MKVKKLELKCKNCGTKEVRFIDEGKSFCTTCYIYYIKRYIRFMMWLRAWD